MINTETGCDLSSLIPSRFFFRGKKSPGLNGFFSESWIRVCIQKIPSHPLFCSVIILDLISNQNYQSTCLSVKNRQKSAKIAFYKSFSLPVETPAKKNQKFFIAPKLASWNFMGTFGGQTGNSSSSRGRKSQKTHLWTKLSKIRRNC